MQPVYVLHHLYEREDGQEDAKLLGVFSSEAVALEKVETYKLLEGFRDYPEGFSIDKYLVDHSYWSEGFTTLE